MAIRIYAPSGALMRSASFVRGAGAYQYTWNGKNASGRVLAPGSYKVVQTLTDAYGTTKAYTTKVYISSKRIYTYTTYVTKTASQYTKRTSAWIGWEFTLPSAAVYKRLWFQVYGRSSGVPPIRFGAWDTRTCTFATVWDPNCTSHSIRGFAYAGYVGSGLVSKARVKVEYGVLK